MKSLWVKKGKPRRIRNLGDYPTFFKTALMAGTYSIEVANVKHKPKQTRKLWYEFISDVKRSSNAELKLLAENKQWSVKWDDHFIFIQNRELARADAVRAINLSLGG